MLGRLRGLFHLKRAVLIGPDSLGQFTTTYIKSIDQQLVNMILYANEWEPSQQQHACMHIHPVNQSRVGLLEEYNQTIDGNVAAKCKQLSGSIPLGER